MKPLDYSHIWYEKLEKTILKWIITNTNSTLSWLGLPYLFFDKDVKVYKVTNERFYDKWIRVRWEVVRIWSILHLRKYFRNYKAEISWGLWIDVGLDEEAYFEELLNRLNSLSPLVKNLIPNIKTMFAYRTQELLNK